MSKLEELIQELCPDGVEHKMLQEVCRFQNGFSFKSTLFKDEGEPILRITNIKEGKLSDDSYVYFDLEDYNENLNAYKVKKGDVVVAMSGATTGKIGYNYSNKEYYLNQRVGLFVPNENVLLKRFLYHWLTMQTKNIYNISSGSGTQPNLSSIKMMKMVIPVPPLEVQCEIVRILDKFTLLTAELTAELTARRKQYEYYKNKLYEKCNKNIIELEKIGQVTKLAGFEFSKYVNYSDDGNIIALRGLNVKNGRLILSDVKYIDNSDLNKLDRSKLYENDILYTYVGTVGQVGLVDRNDKYYLAPNVARIRITDEKLIPKYVMYFLLTDTFKKEQLEVLSGNSSMKNITMSNIRKFKLPILPIHQQEKIVNILDRFNKLCNDITNGLPAEIDRRQKQYEYYRDKLLSFKEVDRDE